MRLSRKDSLGLALAACAVVLLVLHGQRPHAPIPSSDEGADMGVSARAEMTAPSADIIAFVDVRLPGTTHDEMAEGVVVVRRGFVSAVGSADHVTVPLEAAIIDPDGAAYLVAMAPHAAEGTGWTPVTEGVTTELLLLADDPRKTADPGVRGRLVAGRWTPSKTAARSPGVPGGH